MEMTDRTEEAWSDVATSLTSFRDWTARIHRSANGERLEASGPLACAALGICGELGELLEPDADELVEAGDVLSYVFLAAGLLMLDVGDWLPEDFLDTPQACAEKYCTGAIAPRCDILHGATIHALRFAELAKKQVFQGRPILPDAAAWRLRSIVQAVAGFMGTAGYSMRQILLANTLKLESRYPEAARAS